MALPILQVWGMWSSSRDWILACMHGRVLSLEISSLYHEQWRARTARGRRVGPYAATAAPLASQRDLEGVQGTQQLCLRISEKAQGTPQSVLRPWLKSNYFYFRGHIIGIPTKYHAYFYLLLPRSPFSAAIDRVPGTRLFSPKSSRYTFGRALDG